MRSQLQIASISNTRIKTESQDSVENEDFSKLLHQNKLEFTSNGIYYQVGSLTQTQGWILHISAVHQQINEIIITILPILIKYGVSFKVIKNIRIATNLLNGTLGYTGLGKILKIYPTSDKIASELSKELVLQTKTFRGPRIPTDFHLGGCIYTRYGSFSPIIKYDKNGNQDNYIYNEKGELIKDEYRIPFLVPDKVQWPFTDLKGPSLPPPKKLLNDCYKIIGALKSDAKGRVLKVMFMKNLFTIKYALIKEGKENMFEDEHGRNIKDRLEWQKEIHHQLAGKVLLPKIYEYFTENNNAYLAMEFIKGKSLNDKIEQIFVGRHWTNLTSREKLILLNFLIQIIDLITLFHENGYIHRDLTPYNLMIPIKTFRSKKQILRPIDVELAWSKKDNKPYSPFQLGTEGFMSPEQSRVEMPTEKEDIYAIGANMIVFFANLLPISFDQTNLQQLHFNLLPFGLSPEIVDLIVACHNVDPSHRPSLILVKDAVLKYTKEEIKRENKTSNNKLPTAVTKNLLQETIERSLVGLNNNIVLGRRNLWFTPTTETEEHIENSQLGYTYKADWNNGISGIMHVIAIAKLKGYDITNILPLYNRGKEFIKAKLKFQNKDISNNLFTGLAGIALSVSTGIKANLITEEDNLASLAATLNTELPTTLDIQTGISGIGLAILNSPEVFSYELKETFLQNSIDKLLSTQKKDGSWSFFSSDNSKEIVVTGWSQGISGILYFLLRYLSVANNEHVSIAVEKGLRWLILASKRKNTNYRYWNLNNRINLWNPWFIDGTAGIALTFLKAYAIYENSIYKEIAGSALNVNPINIINRDFSMATGMTGLGEVYMQAYKILKSDVWLDKAEWIINILCHVNKTDSTSGVTWNAANSNTKPFAGLMNGNSGIINFLIQYTSLITEPDKSNFKTII